MSVKSNIPGGLLDGVLTPSGQQVVSNKDVDGGTASNTSRITIPKNTKANLDALTRKEGTIVYATDLDKIFYDDGSTLLEVGSGGGGSSGINYIDNGNAEDNNTTGWATYNDGAVSEPVDGTGGSASNFTFTAQSFVALRDTYSFYFSKTGSTSIQGQGISYDFSIDDADLGKRLSISFDVRTDSVYADDDMGIYIYDVDNSTLIYPSTVSLPNTYDNIIPHSIKFNATDSSNYRLIFHAQSTSAINYKVYLDNIIVGPQEYLSATPTTDWIKYTPSNTQGFGTISSDFIEYKRNGDTIDLRGYFTTGTVTASEGQLGLPGSITIGGSGTSSIAVGLAYRDTSSTLSAVVLATKGDSYLNFATFTANAASDPLNPDNGDDWASSTQRISFYAKGIPVAEWAGSANYAFDQPAYYATSGTWDDDDSTTSYTVNGGDITGSLSTQRVKTITTSRPIQPTDIIDLEIDVGGGYGFVSMYNEVAQGSLSGAVARVTGAGTITVYFRKYYMGTDNWTNGWKWRVVHRSSPSPVSYPPTKYIEIIPDGDCSSDGDADWANYDATLKVGQTYRITAKFKVYRLEGDAAFEIHLKDDSTVIDKVWVGEYDVTDTSGLISTHSVSFIHTMASTDFSVVSSGMTSGVVYGSAAEGRGESYVQIEELNNHVKVTSLA